MCKLKAMRYVLALIILSAWLIIAGCTKTEAEQDLTIEQATIVPAVETKFDSIVQVARANSPTGPYHPQVVDLHHRPAVHLLLYSG